MNFRKEYTYNDISLFSRQISTVKSRFDDNIDLNVEVKFGYNIKKVGFLMSSPMYDVTGFNMMVTLLKKGQLPIIHRFMKPNEQLKIFKTVLEYFNFSKDLIFSYSVGINDCEKKLKLLSDFLLSNKLTDNINILICIDTANGANTLLLKPINLINQLKKKHKNVNIEIMSGNVVTKEGSDFLYDMGVKFQRLCISTGSVCSTSVVTGIFRPPVSTIMEIYEYKKNKNIDDLYIIADGGFKENSDYIKAVAVGADFLMTGSFFAGYEESNSSLLVSKNEKGIGYVEVRDESNFNYYKDNIFANMQGFDINYFFKYYRGMASQEMANKNNEVNNIKKKILPEGVSSIVKLKYNLNENINNLLNSFKSSMSYSNSRNIKEFRSNIEIVEITNNSLIQRIPHHE